MAMWAPWRGCHKYSEGCKHCYIHRSYTKRGAVADEVVKLDSYFHAPIERKKNGEYKIKSGSLVYVCFQSDFLIEEADDWRGECWEMILERCDLNFLFLTKRITRFMDCIPSDWGDGYDNVIVGCTIENQETANERLAIFDKLPIKHKNIIAQPLLERIDIEKHLGGVELVVVGGEQDKDARPLDFDWVLDLHKQCARHNIRFQFRQTGTRFIIGGKPSRKTAKELTAENF